MPEEKTDATVAHQVELAIRRLDSLSTLPCVAARVLSQFLQTQALPSALAETIESDPALTAKIFSLMYEQGLSFPDEKPSVRWALGKLPAHIVRDAVLSVKVFQVFDRSNNSERTLSKKELALHALAVASCAKDIAEIASPQINSQLAYSAGLLHDIGKLALREAMPKSFARIVEEAKSQRSSACSIEQKHLGADHTTLGKRLAQKWHLPNQITLAIWLHHSDTMLISQNMPESRIAQIVQLADSMARRCGIGRSGSYDLPDSTEQIAQSLTISPEQLEEIERSLPETVRQKSKVLGLDLPNAEATYCDIVHTMAAQLAHDNTKLSVENRELQTISSHFDFATDFLLSINPTNPPIDAAENFAVRWQKFYQTGPVCLYMINPYRPQFLEAVVVENLAQTKNIILNAPLEIPAIPEALANKFAILNAEDCAGWLLEQLDVDFNLSQTKIVPLLSDSKAIGAIVFELRYPGDSELFREKFKTASCFGGAVLDMAVTCSDQQGFAERFAELLGQVKDSRRQGVAETAAKEARPQVRADSSLIALAEMAAGAAHELNNPLSVISGRAQLLAGAETDPNKKQILTQIQENADELSAIIEDLMTFAEPAQPRPAQTDVRQMLDEAIQLTSQKTNVEHINAQIEVGEEVENVFVDSAQVVSAIANVISNSVESYTDQLGPIKITAESEDSGDIVRVQISDLGCGMDEETLKKATQPFFCSRPAGRKRGMGLAHACRLIQLNNGSLEITSEAGKGTTVTILLRSA